VCWLVTLTLFLISSCSSPPTSMILSDTDKVLANTDMCNKMLPSLLDTWRASDRAAEMSFRDIRLKLHMCRGVFWSVLRCERASRQMGHSDNSGRMGSSNPALASRCSALHLSLSSVSSGEKEVRYVLSIVESP